MYIHGRFRTITYADAKLLQGGSVAARASGTFAAVRTVETHGISAPPPVIPPASKLTAVELSPTFGPAFAQNYEYRLAGPGVFNHGSPTVVGVGREKLPPSTLDARWRSTSRRWR